MKKYLTILALSVLLSFPYQAFADSGDDFGKSAVAQVLMKKKTQPAGSVRSIEAPKPSSPYQYEEEVPDNVDDLMKRVEQQNGALVEEFEKLIEKDPLNPDAPKWLAEIAEFHWQMAHYEYLRARRAWITALDTCSDDPDTCPPEPQVDYHLAIDDYRRILAKYPAYERMDDVLFRLGDALIRNNQSKEGISYLHRLTQSYPDYKDLDAAWLAMGEFYFSQKNTGTAQAAYSKITDNYPDSAFYQYAQYKLAWTYLNLADDDSYLTAIDLFKKVVESIDSRYAAAVDKDGQVDENKLNAGVISFRNQALNDLCTTYVELPNGWKEARTYLSTKLPPDKAREKIEQLGGILDAQGKFEEEIELYGDLLAENPLHPHAIDWRTARVEAFRGSNRLDEAETEIRTTIASCNPQSQWHATNAETDPSAIKRSARFISAQLNTLAIASIEKAEKAKDSAQKDEYWADAETLLSQQLAWYSGDTPSFDINFTYAYVLDERSDGALNEIKKKYAKRLKSEPELASDVLVKLQEAAAAYQKIIDWKDDVQDEERAEQVRVAANRQVFVYANILATSDPEWSIINSAKATNFVEEKRDSKLQDEEPLSEHELGFVRSAEQFSSRYPKDDETPAFLWRAAEIYRTHYHYNQAASRFDEIVSNFPDHQYAAVAVGSMFELYYKASNYEKIEYWAKWLIEHKNFKHYTAQELENTASFAIDKQAVALADESKYDDATSTIMRIVESFPERTELTVAARFKAAAFQEQLKNYKKAIEYLDPVEKQPDTPQNKAHAAYLIALDWTRISHYKSSAAAFERASSQYFDIVNAAEKPAAEAPAKSKKTAKKGEKPAVEEKKSSVLDENARLETALAIFYGAQIYKNIGDNDAASVLLNKYISNNINDDFTLYKLGDDYKVQLTEDEKATAIPVLTPMTATLELASLDAISASENAVTRLSDFTKTDAFAKSPANLQRLLYFQLTQFSIDSKNTESAQKALSHLTPDENAWSKSEMARYNYLQGKLVQIDFEGVVLEFPIRTLRKRIEQKAKLRQNAEKYFQQAISYKNAQISTASAYELAQMALNFRDSFKALPPPKELENDPDALDEYNIWIEDELIFPAEDAASSLLDVGRQITVQLESYTKQAKSTSQALAELKPDEYPVSHSSIDF
ncbi:MAG: tetratricopeptide repeat protein [Proteobacteria bacterium]|nr:tetratricopeptide repeat protein [Pseudomonadota bacterium]